jgi:hypothetical protein
MTAKKKIVFHTKLRRKLKELCKASTCNSLVSANISDQMGNNSKSSISSQHDKLCISVAFTEGRYNQPL